VTGMMDAGRINDNAMTIGWTFFQVLHETLENLGQLHFSRVLKLQMFISELFLHG